MRGLMQALVVGTVAGLAAGLALAIPASLRAQQITAEPPPPSAEALAHRRIVLVTGSTSGLGRELALSLGERGAHVIVHGRSRERGIEVVEEIHAAGRGTASFYAADLGSLAEVRALGEAILRDYERVDVLVNNAGIWLTGDEERYTSDDGIELSFAVNYVSHFLLTRMLLPIVPHSPASRIVNVASGAQTPIDFDDPMIERNYSGGRSYAQSKLAQVMYTFDLAEELAGTGIKVNSLHPATLMDTFMVRNAGVTPRSTIEEGLEAVLNLVESPDVGTGGYYNGLRPARANAQAYDEEARAALWSLSEELVGS
jgi:NAD(P)-dependent dehydrogenase (short-subunit alcohol dehydrogenase family)